MIQKIIISIIDLFDFWHKKKILDFLKKNNHSNFEIFFDVGAHKGETIKLFLKNFNISYIYSFEASPINFKILETNVLKIKKSFKNNKIILENFALGSQNQKANLKQVQESSSSTLSDINENSKYLKKKKKILNLFSNNEYYHNIEVQVITLNDYLITNNIKNISFLKIDTEGHELEILKGLKENLRKVRIVLFEHHFDDMINKKYTFRDINSLLLKNNFKQIYKSKMPFRKTFEYIYINNSI